MYAEAVIIALFLLSIMAALVLNFTFVRTWRPKEQGMLIVALTVSVIVLPVSVVLALIFHQFMLAGTEADRGALDTFITPIGAGLTAETDNSFGAQADLKSDGRWISGLVTRWACTRGRSILQVSFAPDRSDLQYLVVDPGARKKQRVETLDEVRSLVGLPADAPVPWVSRRRFDETCAIQPPLWYRYWHLLHGLVIGAWIFGLVRWIRGVQRRHVNGAL